MFQIATVFALAVVALSALYLGWELAAGAREIRRGGGRLPDQSRLGFGRPHDPSPPPEWFVYFLIPALNEAGVIARTVCAMAGGRESHVVLIDDGSDDSTGDIASAACPDITVLRRDLPAARLGKGAALNAGYAWLWSDARHRGLDATQVIICVMDADGRLSDGALAAVLPDFADPAVGAVQLSVRIRNRDSFLTQYQDFLFWSLAAITQFGRNATGSVSLGGNGQFTRLTALSGLGNEPWSDSLTEDLDLGLRLAIRGWVALSTTGAAVDQQAVGHLRPLIRQRTRWYQGHMTAAKRIPEIWQAKELPHLRALELIAYLLCPWVLDLPWSILFHFCLWGMVTGGQDGLFGTGNLTAVGAVGFWYVVTFFPILVSGIIYYRRDPSGGLLRCLVFSHATVGMNYVSFFCVWAAGLRMLTGRTGWTKTLREAEAVPPPTVDPGRRPVIPGPQQMQGVR